MPSMSVMCAEGDVKISWDPENPEEVKNAKAHFDKLKDSGHLFFRVDGKKKGVRASSFPGSAGELICEFDPAAEIVGTPPVRGG